jgi:arginine exporter protein ArgO
VRGTELALERAQERVELGRVAASDLQVVVEATCSGAKRTSISALSPRPAAAWSTTAVKPVMAPERTNRRMRSAAAFALRPATAPRRRCDARPLCTSSPRIALSMSSIAALCSATAGFCLIFACSDPTLQRAMNALAAGIVAGLAVAIPLGAIGVLIVDLGVRGGFRPAFLAGLGTALADGLYATVAAVAGLAVGAWLAPAEHAIALAAAAALAAVGVYGLVALRREPAARALPPADHRLVARFLALTALNPATAATFAGLIVGLPAVAHASAPGKAAFVVGAFGASLAWQSTLAGGGALMRHGLPPSARTWTSVIGRVLVLALAIKLALGA